MTYTIEAVATGGRKTRRAQRPTLQEAKAAGETFFFEEADTTRIYILRPRGGGLVARSDGRSTGPRFSHRVTWHKIW